MDERSRSHVADLRKRLGGGRFPLGLRARERAHRLIPGGSHTYAKGDDQFPEHSPPFIVRGAGCHVWDADGNEFIEYNMGLRAVTLGHAFAPVIQAVGAQLGLGSNFNRPALIESECAAAFLDAVPTMEMVKFCKDGSTAVDGAIRLARAYTGRDFVARCTDHPFFSTSDWFIGSTRIPAGIPRSTREMTLGFPYGDLHAVGSLFERYPGQVACLILEPSRIKEPDPGYLQGLQALCRDHGSVLVFDEMITGFRWHRSGAQHVYGVTPDLSTFGKALANGFALSALAGRRELMELGGLDTDKDRVFLLSTTHGAETHSLAAGIATLGVYSTLDVTEALHRQGARLRRGVEREIRANGVQDSFAVEGRDCCLYFVTLDAEGKPSQAFRTLFMQEMVRRGILAPSFVVSYSHSDADIDATIEIVGESLSKYRKGLEDGAEAHLEGRPVKPVFRPRP